MLEYGVTFTNWLQFSSFHLFHTPMCVKTASKSLLKLKKKKENPHCVEVWQTLCNHVIKVNVFQN